MIRYGSVCSGVEAASLAWEPLGWSPAWFSEIDPAASGVLAYHWPDVPNLGDMLADDFVSRAKTHGHIDVLVGGTPCQSWSVAGKREGANDPRGKLTYRFLTIAKDMNPEWIVWENVPGILSIDNGKPFEQFLDYILALGYVIHCDILNAEFFGVPQRRRRVFVVCHRVNILTKQKTSTSSSVLIETLGKISQSILTAHIAASGSGQKHSASSCDLADGGLLRTMLPFSKVRGSDLAMWLKNSGEEFPSVHPEPKCLVSKVGRGTGTATNTSRIATATKSLDSNECRDANIPRRSRSTGLSLRKCWAEVFSLARSCTTSTITSKTTEETIWWFLQVLVRTGRSMVLSGKLSPCYSSAALSLSTAIEELTNYVRSTNEPLFVESGIRNLRADLLREAEHTRKAVASAREGFDPREVLFESEGVRGNSAPGGEEGKGTPGYVVPSLVASGRGVARAGDSRGQDPVIPVAVAMRGRDGGATCEIGGDVANALRSADGGGSKPFVLAETCPTLCSSGKAETPPAVAYQCHGSNVGPLGLLRAGNGGVTGGVPFTETNLRVRRLLPVECERLQGMKDGHTARTNEKELADGPRYKLIGNSMAVPVMAWIGERIRRAL